MKKFNIRTKNPVEMLEQAIPGVNAEEIQKGEELLESISRGLIAPGILTISQILNLQRKIKPFSASRRQYNNSDQS